LVAVSVWWEVIADKYDAITQDQAETINDDVLTEQINLAETAAEGGLDLGESVVTQLSESEVQKLIEAQSKSKQQIANLKKQLGEEQAKRVDAEKKLVEQQSLTTSLVNRNDQLSDQLSTLDNQVNINQFELRESLKRERKLNQTLKAERLQHANLLSSSIDQIKSKIDQKPDLLKTVNTADPEDDSDVADVNEEAPKVEDHFSGAVEFGFNFDRDNQRTKGVEGRLILDYNVKEKYNVNSDMQFEYENEDGEDTEDELRWQLQGNYNLTPVDTAFIRSDIQRSGFASYEKEDTFTVGYGHIFFNENNHKFNVEVGPGYKLAVPNDGEDDVSFNEYILRTKLNYERIVTESLQISTQGIVELGHENSVYEIGARAQNRIYQELYLIFDVNYKYNQNVPVDTRNDELSTGLNLQYAF